MSPKKYVGFLTGTELQLACVEYDRAHHPSIIKHQTFLLADDNQLLAFFSSEKEFGKKLTLIVAEEGVYSFMATVPQGKISNRKEIEQELVPLSPESIEQTLWDYKIVNVENGFARLEITEMKYAWTNFIQFLSDHGIRPTSIIPESLSLVQQVLEPGVSVIIHQKADNAVLLLCGEGQNIVSALLFQKPLSSTEIVGFLEFCRAKKEKEVARIICSGFDTQQLQALSLSQDIIDKHLDPFLGVAESDRLGGSETLDFVESLPHKAWYKFW